MPTDAPAREKTKYLILRQTPVEGQDSAIVYDPVDTGIAANSAEHALRVWAETQTAGQGGMYVAIPIRSFRPMKLAFEQTTVVKLGDA